MNIRSRFSLLIPMTEKMVASRVSSYLSTVCGGMHVHLTLFLAYRNGPNVCTDAAFGRAIIVCGVNVLDPRFLDRCNNSRFSNCIYISFVSLILAKNPKA